MISSGASSISATSCRTTAITCTPSADERRDGMIGPTSASVDSRDTCTVGVLQPGYLPWLGFFDQMRRCTTFVLYDDVPYDKGGWRNRNRIKCPSGSQWLTVPVRTRHRFGQSILDV